MNYRLLGLVAGVFLAATPAFATPVALIAGQTVDTDDYANAEVQPPDPDWFGAVIDNFSVSANRTRDGFDGFDVVDGLYNVDAFLDVDVVRATNGQLVFAYDLTGSDNVGFSSGDPNGVIDFTVTGFEGYDILLAYEGPLQFGFPYAPTISRSADGDAITVEYLSPEDPLLGGIERILLSIDAPTYRATGGGTAGIALDTFGTEQVAWNGRLPAPAPIPLPAGGLLLMAAVGGLAALRCRST